VATQRESGSERLRDRRDAGRRLARRFDRAEVGDAVVLALPRGGVPVGYEIARALGVPLDVLVVRKLGVPGYEELAMGAIATGHVRVMNEHVVELARVSADAIEQVAARELRELERREREYRGDRALEAVAGRHAIVVDDGLATGATMRAAIAALRLRAPARITVAVPVGSSEALRAISTLADDVVTAFVPRAAPSASGTTTSGPRRTTRCASCSTRRPRARPRRPDPGRRRPARSEERLHGPRAIPRCRSCAPRRCRSEGTTETSPRSRRSRRARGWC